MFSKEKFWIPEDVSWEAPVYQMIEKGGASTRTVEFRRLSMTFDF